jgi:hypothetical protein
MPINSVAGTDVTDSLVKRAETPNHRDSQFPRHRRKRGIDDNSVVTAFDDVNNIDVDQNARPPTVSAAKYFCSASLVWNCIRGGGWARC